MATLRRNRFYPFGCLRARFKTAQRALRELTALKRDVLDERHRLFASHQDLVRTRLNPFLGRVRRVWVASEPSEQEHKRVAEALSKKRQNMPIAKSTQTLVREKLHWCVADGVLWFGGLM
jgi:hypothetical protein